MTQTRLLYFCSSARPQKFTLNCEHLSSSTYKNRAIRAAVCQLWGSEPSSRWMSVALWAKGEISGGHALSNLPNSLDGQLRVAFHSGALFGFYHLVACDTFHAIPFNNNQHWIHPTRGKSLTTRIRSETQTTSWNKGMTNNPMVVSVTCLLSYHYISNANTNNNNNKFVPCQALCQKMSI